MAIQHWLLLICIQLVWSLSYTAMKWALAEMNVAVLLFLRYGIATFIFALLFFRKRNLRFQRHHLWIMLGVGVLNFFISPWLQFTSLRFTQATDVSIIVVFEPLITVIMAAIILKEHPPKTTWVALLLGMIGMLLLSGFPHLSGQIHWVRMVGNFLFLLSLFCEGTCSVMGRILGGHYHPGISIAVMTASGFLMGASWNFPLISQTDFSQISSRGWAAVSYLAIACGVLGYSLWYRVIQSVPVNHAALSLFLQPVLGTVFGYFLLHETIGWGSFLGAAMICISLIWWQVRSLSNSSRIKQTD